MPSHPYLSKQPGSDSDLLSTTFADSGQTRPAHRMSISRSTGYRAAAVGDLPTIRLILDDEPPAEAAR